MLQGRKILVLLLWLAVPVIGAAQTAKGVFGENSVEYRSQRVGGVLLHSHGIGGTLAFGKHTTGFKRRMIQFELVSMRHSKEIRSFNPQYQDSKSYVFGKLNSVFLIRPTYGYKTVKYDKMRKSGVEFGYAWAIGPSFALLKPVYLEIGDPEFPYKPVKLERYDPSKHNINNIFGRASSLKGIDELNFSAGLFGKFGIVFEYAPLRESIRAIEVGTSIDIFPKELKILATERNQNIFLNFYVQLLFGKKYIQ